MSRLNKHLGIGEPVTIDGEEFILKPLGTEAIPLFFKAMKAFSGAKANSSTEDMLKNIDDSGLNAVRQIIDKTLEASFPDEPKTDRDLFGMKYMGILLPKIFELNSADVQGTKNKEQLLSEVRQAVNDGPAK